MRGRVTFASYASNLYDPSTPDPQTTPGRKHIYLHDRDPDGNGVFDELNGKTELISDSYLVEGDADSQFPKLSDDATWIAFSSRADDLISFDNNGRSDVFFQNLYLGWYQQGSTSASVSSAGVLGNDDSYCSAISGDGSRIAFVSYASNLVANDPPGLDLFVRDRVAGTTTHVASDILYDPLQWPIPTCSFSRDGTKLVFGSYSTTLVAPDYNGGASDVFVYDSVQGTTTRVDVSSSGVQADYGGAWDPDISRDGTYVVFTSEATDLAPWGPEDGGYPNVYFRDLVAGVTTLVTANPYGHVIETGDSYLPLVADQGDFAVFTSEATDLVSDDTNGVADVYLWDR